MIAPARYTVDTADVQLPGNRALRVTLSRDPAGEPDTLTLATGWAGPWREDGHRLSLPGYLLPEIRDALAALEAES